MLSEVIELRLISPMALARIREALTNGWDKHDPRDAQVILNMVQIGACRTFHDPLANAINDIQELSQTDDMVSRAKTGLWHRLLTHRLSLYLSEAERFRGDARSEWFLRFLEASPKPRIIQDMTRDEVYRCRLGRRR